jgi:hypothetical protein
VRVRLAVVVDVAERRVRDVGVLGIGRALRGLLGEADQDLDVREDLECFGDRIDVPLRDA